MIINENDVKVFGRVVSTAIDGKVASAEQIFDDTYQDGMFQSDINNETKTHLQEVDEHLKMLDDNTIEDVTAEISSTPNVPPTVNITYENGKLNFNFDGLQGDAASIKIGTTTTGLEGSQAKVTNSGTEEEAILNFVIPRGNTGPKGERGDGWQIKKFVDSVSDLPDKNDESNVLGDTYLVGTTTPYNVYIYNGTDFVNVGTVNEIKASVIDGGRADTKYGGARTIDCGGADSFLTT